ncbi:hypothetical protein C0J52_25881 [Blattella germanica]|nr:hypothetical protein C0J52_25881 [Blattella germanica]
MPQEDLLNLLSTKPREILSLGTSTCDISYKSSTNATTVRTQLQHFESAINDIRNKLPEPDCNSHYSVKRVRKDSDVRVEAREACDIIGR